MSNQENTVARQYLHFIKSNAVAAKMCYSQTHIFMIRDKVKVNNLNFNLATNQFILYNLVHNQSTL